MITSISHGNFSMTAIRSALPETVLFTMVVFDSVNSRDVFAKQFPKSMRVTSSIMSGYKLGEDRKQYMMGENGRLIPEFYPYCSVRISCVNETTGHSNEQGRKRMDRFYSAILSQYNAEGSVNLEGLMYKYGLDKY